MPLPMMLALVLAAQAAPAAPSSAAPAPTEAELQNSPDWLRLPSDSDIAAVYPVAARRQKIAGRADLDCVLTEEGGLADCRVAEEAPAGYGFGQAALRLTPRFRMTPLYPDGRSVAGGRVEIPISFSAKRR